MNNGTKCSSARAARLVLVVPLALLASGCANVVAQNAASALQTAESRARFELDCQNVEATVLSQKVVQGFRFEGSEYTIGVRGCGKQAIYVTYCADQNNCNALSQTGRVDEMQRQLNAPPSL